MCSSCEYAGAGCRTCPEYENERPAFYCVNCEAGIFTGERYAESENGYICEDCIDSLSKKSLLECFGIELKEV